MNKIILTIVVTSLLTGCLRPVNKDYQECEKLAVQYGNLQEDKVVNRTQSNLESAFYSGFNWYDKTYCKPLIQ